MKSPALLHIDASPRSSRSQSRSLGRDFLAAWQQAHPAGAVATIDLAKDAPPFVSEPWVEGAFVPADQQSPAAKEAIAVSNSYVNGLLAADQIFITTPMYNLSIPAVLKAWIDQIVRYGLTFTINEKGYAGLVHGKRVLVLVSTGGDFRPGQPAAGYNFVEPYLRALFGFLGITDVQIVYAYNQNQGAEAGELARTEARAAMKSYLAANAA